MERGRNMRTDDAKTGERAAMLDANACYAAFRAHDARFDGRFFIGIASTGIYCRPVCRVRMPKAENCSYHVSAAAAEAAGFRPCLKCRPELAPGQSLMDARERLVRKAASIIEEDSPDEDGIDGLAEALGVSGRHLRRVFSVEYGVSPVRFAQTCRLLLAKSLLTDTGLPVTNVAFASGFGSLRRFNDLFKRHYRMTPTDLRRSGGNPGGKEKDAITLRLGYRPPYRWDRIAGFLADRAVSGVESAGPDFYRRTVAVRDGNATLRGWISVVNEAKRNALAVTVSSSLLPVLPKVLGRVKALFDLNAEPLEIYEKLSVMNAHTSGLFTPGLRVPGCFDPFEMAVRAVLGQQITLRAARTLAARLASAFGDSIATPFGELTHVFPAPGRICALETPIGDRLGPLGITGIRARAISALAGALVEGSIALDRTSDPQTTMTRLLALPGFGPWTVQYIAMRVLGWPDAFPHTDYGVKTALGGLSPERILELSENWRPWRSYATIGLWASLNRPAGGEGEDRS